MTKNKESTRYYSELQEKRVAENLNGSVCPNSGAGKFSKSDVQVKDASLSIECKTCMTDKDSFSIKKSWFEKQKEEALKIKEQLTNIVVEFSLKSNNGKVFGSVSFKQVEEELKAKHNIVIDKRKITTKGPVDQLGYTKLNIELFKGVVGVITVHVKEEK